ncbi:MAG TPA: 3-oxoacyl-ACP reductase FabG [Alphaproteobacteria bacterium]|nr:3-oxoacyl-ACP reductase FabG [Alphaproteobacteria bacterium]
MNDGKTGPLSGKVAIVTGAARNIGRAIALALAGDGAAVVINARSAAKDAEAVAAEVDAAGGQGFACLADISDQDAVESLVARTVDRFGRLDILVNNASIRRLIPFGEMSLEEWRAVMSVSLDGPFLCARAALPHLVTSDWGTIVNIGGLTAHVGAKARAHAVTAKAGVVGLTRALAVELAENGITVNCVVPGDIDTDRPASAGKLPPLPKNLAGRKGRPEEVAGMVRHLCGPTGRYITGQVIHVNGGSFLP